LNLQLISFATPNFYFSQYKLLAGAKKFDINQVFIYNHTNFKKTNFYKENQLITQQPRGAGYWIWKPYYILEHLNSLNDDDILIYCDAGVQIIENIEPLIALLAKSDNGIMLFENYQGSAYFSKSIDFAIDYNGIYIEPNKNKYWCKGDIFHSIAPTSKEILDSPQVDANIMLFKKTKSSFKFVNEWLEFCKIQQLITDSTESIHLNESPTFFAHLHDQSILSVLAAKWNIELFRCPTQFGNHFKLLDYRKSDEFLLLPYSPFPKNNSSYGTIFLHTRFRTIPFINRWKDFLTTEVKLIFVSCYLKLYRSFKMKFFIK
jgi:hypothetical protein